VVVVQEYGAGTVVSGGCVYPPVGERYYGTSDGGRTWRLLRRVPLATSDPYTTSVEQVDARRIVAGRSDGSTLISADAGRSFRPAGKPVDGGFVAALSFSGPRGFALTDTGVWRSPDAGATWTLESSAYSATGVGAGDIATAGGTAGIAGGAGTLSCRCASVTPARAARAVAPRHGRGLLLTTRDLRALRHR
jgi:hypothetical protein